MKKVCILGLGYIGLPTAALLANRGYKIHGVDVVQSVVDTINEGKIHIVEPELDVFVKKAVQSGNLKADVKPDFADIFYYSCSDAVSRRIRAKYRLCHKCGKIYNTIRKRR